MAKGERGNGPCLLSKYVLLLPVARLAVIAVGACKFVCDTTADLMIKITRLAHAYIDYRYFRVKYRPQHIDRYVLLLLLLF